MNLSSRWTNSIWCYGDF